MSEQSDKELCNQIYHDFKRLSLDFYNFQHHIEKLMVDIDALGGRLTKKMEANYELAKDS